MKRTLNLKSETLAEITPGELAGVAGGLQPATLPFGTCVSNPPTFPPTCYSFPWC